MASYDSDSSGAEDDYTETNVLLGYASKEPTGDSISHLGGHPTWLDDKSAPPGDFAKCKVCNSLLTLLLQLNGDLPDHFTGHERRLYILSCRQKACRRKPGSTRAFRGVRLNKTVEASATTKPSQSASPPVEDKKPAINLGATLFGVAPPSGGGVSAVNPFSSPSSSNPFASSAASSQSANPFATASSLAAKPPQPPATTATPSAAVSTLPETFAEKVRLSSPIPPESTQKPARPHEPWPAQSSFPKPYPFYHLDAEYETLDKSDVPAVPQATTIDLDGEGSGGAGGQEDKELFESSLDKAFQRFADRLGQNPDQVLRYEFRGTPLLYSKTDAVGKLLSPSSTASDAKVKTAGSARGSGFPRCTNCGADRVFEVQLTPQAIAELEVDEDGLEGMEWGTVVLGVCNKDCSSQDVKQGDVGYLEEWVGVQWEEVKGKGP